VGVIARKKSTGEERKFLVLEEKYSANATPIGYIITNEPIWEDA
jgi:hypothetical protein